MTALTPADKGLMHQAMVEAIYCGYGDDSIIDEIAWVMQTNKIQGGRDAAYDFYYETVK